VRCLISEMSVKDSYKCQKSNRGEALCSTGGYRLEKSSLSACVRTCMLYLYSTGRTATRGCSPEPPRAIWVDRSAAATDPKTSKKIDFWNSDKCLIGQDMEERLM